MTRVKENVEKLNSLLKEKEELNSKIESLKKEISNEYLDYVKERFEEQDERYVILNGEYFHLGKFECFGWCGEKNDRRKPGYANDYEAFFELIHGFNASLPWINNYGLDITKQPRIEIDTDYKEAKYSGQIYIKDVISFITKEDYEKKYEEVKKEYKFATTEATSEDATGKTLHVGNKISYMRNRKGPYIGKISMIIGKKVYVENDGGYMGYKTVKID